MPPAPSAYVGRLAPAPTGALHLGNARTFLVAWLRARQAGGRLLLRLEDLDHPKVKPRAAAQVYEDLRWLGLDWDDGADQTPELVQSNRRARYRAILERLSGGGRVYPCGCSRRELESIQSAPQDGVDAPEYRYPNRCRPPAPPPPEPRCLRFRLDVRPDLTRQAFVDVFHGARDGDLERWSGDFVVARDWDHAAYQLAVVVDDHDGGVSEVVRGDDLLSSTERQLALYRALGWTPPAFCHVPLVVGPDGRRLAKRHGDTRLSAFRGIGVEPERIVAWLAETLGCAVRGRLARPGDLLASFNLASVPRDRIAFAGPQLFAAPP